MGDPILRALAGFVGGLALGAASGCSFYSPTAVDCSITCGESGPCPRGTSCRNGFCRLDSAQGECACKLGDTRPCGGGRGECKPGTEVCTSERVWSGICVNEGKPAMEVCNNKDDDCDGLVDDDVTDRQACALTLGVCAGARNRCESGSQLTCEASDYGPRYQTAETRCDGEDNDCDGFADVRGVTLLSAEASMTAPFQMLALPQGFALVFVRTPSNGPTELLVARFDDAMQFQRNALVWKPAPLAFHARALGDAVFVATTVDGGVWLTRVDTTSAPPDGGPERFAPLLDAGYSSGLRLGLGEEAVSTYLADGEDRARTLVWQLDGGLSLVKDLNAGPGVPATVTLNSCNVSDRGHYVIYSADDSNGDTVRQLIRLGDGGVWTPPYYGGVEAELNEWDAGVSCTYPYSESSSSLSGIYYLPDLTLGITEVAAAASNLAQQWAAMSAFRTPAGDLQVAMQERVPGGGERVVVGTSAPVGTTFTFRLRNLDGGAGPPGLVPSADQSWLIVGWREANQLRARKVCAP
ncbi:MAG: hypothetical protein JNJ54_14965 [Myxococcaceae bacterium]|nr:hypothetical protein [Myxococcaceae bacterium]